MRFRGKARLPYYKQLLDHSTFLFPYSAMVYVFSGVSRKPFLDVKHFPELTPIGENCATIAAEARELHDKGHIVRTPVFRFINRFVTRHVAKLTSSRNVDTERLGVMNLLA